MSNILKTLAAGSASEPTDEYFNQTTLLLHGDGTNGAQNNTFLDSSTNNFTITRNGNTTQGTFSPFSLPNGEWSNYFDGTSAGSENRISGTVTAIGTGNFTIAFWVYVTGSTTKAQIFCDGDNSIVLQINTSNQVGFYDRIAGTFAITQSASTLLPTQEWAYVSLIRSGTGTNQTKLYINGSEVGSATVTSNFTGTSMSIGSRYTASGTDWFPTLGYISNFIYADSALSSAVPTAPSSAVSGTRLLTCQSNRFIDNSGNSISLTATSVKVQPFSPFAPSAAYSPSVNGGSGYFDGSGDGVTTSSSAMSYAGDYCLECFFYTNTTTTYACIYSDEASGTGATILLNNGSNNGQITTYGFGVSNFASTTTGLNNNAWHHVAITLSGTTLRLFIDGVLENTATGITVPGTTTSTVRVGTSFFAGRDFGGYISNFRIVVGSPVYTSTFTPPTAPLTAITNTSLLLNFTNAGIFDNTGKNNLQTLADAQIDTTTKKYGTGSMEFDGTGDYLQIPHSPNLLFGTGNFTIECWWYPTSLTYTSIFDKGFTASGAILLQMNSSGEFEPFLNGTRLFFSSTALTINNWYHIALVRSGSTVTFYLNGVSDGSGTSSADLNNTSNVGICGNVGGGDDGAGFIDDLRITKGVARYTTTFTPPSRAFPDL